MTVGMGMAALGQAELDPGLPREWKESDGTHQTKRPLVSIHLLRVPGVLGT